MTPDSQGAAARLLGLGALLLSAGAATPVFQETDGLVIMQAEATTSPRSLWELRFGPLDNSPLDNSPSAGAYLVFMGNTVLNGPPKEPLEYKFFIGDNAGTYILDMRAAKERATVEGEERDDVANDCYVRVSGNFTPGPGAPSQEDLLANGKYYGGPRDKFGWLNGYGVEDERRLDLHHAKYRAAYNFQANTEYTLLISGRSKLFKLDVILLRLEDRWGIINGTNKEARAKAEEDASGHRTSVTPEKDGLVIMEAEATTSPRSLWKLRSGPLDNSPSGGAYLEFMGWWLINGVPVETLEYKFFIGNAGTYILDMRAAKQRVVIYGVERDDVANDCYVRVTGNFTPGPHAPSQGDLQANKRYYGGLRDQFGWLNGFGVDDERRLDIHGTKYRAAYNFEANTEYTLFISGRSRHFKLDLILFRLEDQWGMNNSMHDEAREEAEDLPVVGLSRQAAKNTSVLSEDLPTSASASPALGQVVVSCTLVRAMIHLLAGHL